MDAFRQCHTSGLEAWYGSNDCYVGLSTRHVLVLIAALGYLRKPAGE